MLVVSMVNSARRIDPLNHGLLLSVARSIRGLFLPYSVILIPSHFSFPTLAYKLVTVCEAAVKAVRSLPSFFICTCNVLVVILIVIVILSGFGSCLLTSRVGS